MIPGFEEFATVQPGVVGTGPGHPFFERSPANCHSAAKVFETGLFFQYKKR